MTTYKIALASTGETMTGLDGEALSGLDHASAKQLVRELSQVWARELDGDTLEITEEVDAEVARVIECAEDAVSDGVAVWGSDSNGRSVLTITYGANADDEAEADAECEESRLEVARRFRGLAITVSDSGAVGGTERGYYSVLAARGRVIYRDPSNYA